MGHCLSQTCFSLFIFLLPIILCPLSPSSFFERTSFYHVTPLSLPSLSIISPHLSFSLFSPLFFSPPPVSLHFLPRRLSDPSISFPPAVTFSSFLVASFAFHPSFFISGYFSSPSIALCFCLH